MLQNYFNFFYYVHSVSQNFDYRNVGEKGHIILGQKRKTNILFLGENRKVIFWQTWLRP